MAPQGSPRGETPFLTTRWSVVLAAGKGQEPSAQRALAELCETYWYPLYAYVRRRGHRGEDARDLTQAFFARLLEKNAVGAADPGRGRFRAFLLGALKNFLANEWDRERAQKRGGGQRILSLDFEQAEGRFQPEPQDPRPPDNAFEREWALEVLQRALQRLRADYVAKGRGTVLARLEGCLVPGGATQAYKQLAEGLGMSEGAVKVAVHRLRAAFREALREEIAQTVEGPEELEDELRDLIAALSG